MLIDPAQSTDTNLLPKLVQHAYAGPMPPQSAEPAPSGLFGQLRHHQIERMGRSQQDQQMQTPQLRRAQSASSSAGGQARTQIENEVVRHIG